RRAPGLRMRAAGEGLSGIPNPFDGRVDRDPSGADAAAADPCQRHPDQRTGAGAGEVVQSAARIRLPDLRGGDAGHLCPYGDLAPIRDDRVAPRSVRAGALWTRLQGNDGRRDPAGVRRARPVVPLATPFDITKLLA